MPKLKRNKAGGYYTVRSLPGANGIRYLYTLQIREQGVEYLLERSLREGEEIPQASLRFLTQHDLFFTKQEQPGPGSLDGGVAPEQSPDTEPLDDHLDVEHLSGDPEEEWIGGQPYFPTGPKLFFDAQKQVHYTVFHLPGKKGLLDATVMLIKYRAVQWLREQGASIGEALPDGTFAELLEQGWVYPNSGLTPREASVIYQLTELDELLQPHVDAHLLVKGQERYGQHLILRWGRRIGASHDETALRIKAQGVKWLEKRGVQDRDELPVGAFRTLFERRWFRGNQISPSDPGEGA